MEVRGVEQDIIPYVRQLVLHSVAVEGWIIDSNVLDGPGKGMWPPTHNWGIVQFGMMTLGVGKVINVGRFPEMFL